MRSARPLIFPRMAMTAEHPGLHGDLVSPGRGLQTNSLRRTAELLQAPASVRPADKARCSNDGTPIDGPP